jgi:TP901 family phage tail tape measure protein
MSSNKLALMVEFGSAGLDKLSSGLRAMTADSKKSSAGLRALNREHRDIQKAIKANAREMQNASGNITHLADKERELQAQLSATNRQLEKQERLLAATTRADGLRQRGADMRQAGKDHMVGGAVMAAPFALAVKSAAEFGSGMVDLQQKADMSDAATKRLGATIMRAARDAKQMPEDMRAGVDVLAGFGMAVPTAMEMMTPIGRIAAAMKVDLADGAAAAFANTQNLKVSVGETAKALDIMAAAGNAGAFEVKDMAKHFPGLTAQANALGESGLGAVANLSAALQITRRATGSSDEAANNLQNLYAKITSEGTVKAFSKQFGVDLPAEMAKAKAAGMDTLEAIASITKKATKGDLSKIGLGFSDMQAQSAIRALIMNLEDYKTIRDDAVASEGVVDKAFAQRAANDPTVMWRELMGHASGFAIMAGTALLPALTEVGASMAGVMTNVAAWTQANPEATATIVKLAAGAVAAKIGLGALMFAAGGILGPISTLYGLFGKARALGVFSTMLGKTVNAAIWAGPKLMQAFGMMRTAAMFLASGMMKAGLMMLANPMVLVIGAIVLALAGAAYWAYTNWDKISAAFKNGVAAVGQAIETGKARVLAFVDNFKSIGSNIVGGIAAGITAAPGRVWDALKGVVSGAWNNAKAFLGIKSPSRLFATMGGFVSEGLALGIDRGADGPAGSAARLASDVASAFNRANPQLSAPFGKKKADFAEDERGQNAAIERKLPSLSSLVSLTFPEARQPSAPAAAGAGGITITGPITIQLAQQPGQDAGSLAKQIQAALEKLGQKQARGSYEDR